MLDTLVGKFSEEEFIFSGHNACPGCGPTVGVRHILKVLGEKALFVIPPCCWGVICGAFPYRSLRNVVVYCTFAAGATVGAGVKKGLEAVGDFRTQVVVLAGDGGTFDIGLQGLSAVAERNEDILFVCYDNEFYMNTGMQKSSATPYGSISTTTPAPKIKSNSKKDIMKIMVSHNIPYAATTTIAFPQDLITKFQKAIEIHGFRFIHVLTPCPQGWGIPTGKTVELSRLAVLSGIFPLWEVTNEGKYTINYAPKENKLLEDYFRLQKRYSSLTNQNIEVIRENVERNLEDLYRQAGISRYV